MARRTRPWLILVFVALGLAAILWSMFGGNEPVILTGDINQDQPHTKPLAAPGISGTQATPDRASIPSVSGGEELARSSSDQALSASGQVRMLSGKSAGRGTLLWHERAPEGEQLRIATIEHGGFAPTPELLSDLEEHRFGAEALRFIDEQGTAIQPFAAEVKSEGIGDEELVIMIPDAWSMPLRVVDLRGEPIAGAQVSIGRQISNPDETTLGSSKHLGKPRVTEGDGTADLLLYGTHAKTLIRVHAPGYAAKERLVSINEQGSLLEMPLPRVLGVGVITNREQPATVSWGKSRSCSRAAGRAAALDDYHALAEAQLFARESLAPTDIVRWFFSEETEWAGDCETAVSDSTGGDATLSATVIARQPNSPDLEIIRMDGAAPEGLALIDVTMRPLSAFLASCPEEMLLRFKSMGDDRLSGGSLRRGFLMKGSTYRFSVPPGTYNIEPPRMELIKKLGIAPEIVPVEDVSIQSVGVTSAIAHLAPGCFYTSFEFVDAQGFEFPLYAWLTNAGTSPVWSDSNRRSKQRFVQVGNKYSVVGWNLETRSHLTLVDSVDVPGDLSPGESWKIRIPLAMQAQARLCR